MITTPRIPLAVASLGDAEARYVREALDENELSRGRFVDALERAFADLHGRPDAVATSSGTASLHLALVELGCGPGDEVIVPSLTFVATVEPVRYVGATPVFADADPETYCVSAETVEPLIGPKTKAILVTDLYGHPVDIGPVMELARAHGLAVAEDATEALGSTYRGALCGTEADIACFSFNHNKVATAAGGGMLIAPDPERLAHMRYLTRHAREPTRDYAHGEVGFNYGLSNVHAAIGLGQMERLDELLARRRQIAARYAEALVDVSGLTFRREAPWAKSNFWLCSVLVDEAEYGASRDELLDRLDRAGIDARPFFSPLQLVGPYRQFARGELPVSARLSASGVSLPSSASLDDGAQDRVIEVLRGA